MKKKILFLFAAAALLPVMAKYLPLPSPKEKIPADVRENPYVEYADLLTPESTENARQFVLFSRPLTDPVWAETRPQAYERIDKLTGWGAQKQYVSLNFALYPLKELKDLSISIESSSVKPELRVVRYWNIIYPFYHSFRTNPKDKQYRRMPEFLAACNGMEKVAAGEPQRFILTFELPADGSGKLEGSVVINHSGLKTPVRLPYSVRILPFELKRDPNKHYFAFHWSLIGAPDDFYVRNRSNKKLIHETLVKEYKRMLEYGFTRPPHMRMSLKTLPDGTPDTLFIPDYDIHVAALKEAGFDLNQGVLVCGAGVHRLFKRHTGRTLDKHMRLSDGVPEQLYTDLASALDKFLAHAEKNNYPPLIYNPLDEPDPASLPLIAGVFEIFKKRGLKTMLTSPPASFMQKRELFDILNYPQFFVPYKKVVADRINEYWCYPNDNAYQIKDPNVMCHGGRMTYGLGYWKSGFTGILPYVWREGQTSRLSTFGGNMTWEDGTLLMTPYWECFRLGEDDLRYIYTLQDDIVKRKGCKGEKEQQILADAEKLLQRVWNAACPQGAYLRDNLIHHAELDAYRALVANEILKVRQIPECNKNNAPSVIVDPDGKWINPAHNAGNSEVKTLPLTNWKSLDQEGTISEHNGNSLTYTIKVDHTAGGPGAHEKYPVGWPRLFTDFGVKRPGVDLTGYEQLEFDLTVSSDRDAEANYLWPISLLIRAYDWSSFCNKKWSDSLEPDVKHRIVIPMSKLIPQPKEGFKKAASLQFFIGEANYPHGCTLKMKFENIRFVGYKTPTIAKVEYPAVVELPCNGFSIPVEVVGCKGRKPTFSAQLIGEDGKVAAETSGNVNNGKAACGFAGKDLNPGRYQAVIKIIDNGKSVSETVRNIEVVKGPAAQ